MDNLSGSANWQVADPTTKQVTYSVEDTPIMSQDNYTKILDEIISIGDTLQAKLREIIDGGIATKGLYDAYVTSESLNKIVKNGLHRNIR